MRTFRLIAAPVTTMLLLGAVGGASAYAGVVYATKRAPTLSSVCVSAGTKNLTAPVKGACPRGTVLHTLPGGPRGATGPAGLPGPTGPQGVAGTNGTNGTNGTDGKNGMNGTDGKNGATKVTVVEKKETVGPNTDFTFLALCPTGSTATGGGFSGALAATAKIVSSTPRFSVTDRKPIGWDVRLYNSGAASVAGAAYVLCASP